MREANASYFLSEDVRILKKDDVFAFYDRVTNKVLFGDAEAQTLLYTFSSPISKNELDSVLDTEGKRSIFSLFRKNGFILESGERSAYRRFKDFITSSMPTIHIAYLIPTDRCNLDCKYCFVEQNVPNGYQFSHMDIETADFCVDYFLKWLTRDETKKKEFIFYGGEPLLNWEVLEHVVGRIRASERRGINLTVITNGTLITEEIASFLAKNDVRVSLSLDGFKKCHDDYRPYHNGKGSFDDAARGYRVAKHAGVSIGISCTVGHHNIQYLVENVRYLIDEFKPEGMGLNILLDLLDRPNPCAPDYTQVAEQIINCFKLMREAGVYEDRVGRRARAVIKNRPMLKDCGGCGNQLVFAPNGDIGPCHAFITSRDYFVGNVRDDINIESNETFREWNIRTPFTLDDCVDCDTIGICGGGCPYHAYVDKGSIWKKDERTCILCSKLQEFFVWDLYEGIKKKLSSQDNPYY